MLSIYYVTHKLFLKSVTSQGIILSSSI